MTSPLPSLKPMKMTDIPFTDAELYLANEDYVLEQKHDGARALISAFYEEAEGSLDPRWTFFWQASGGGPLKFAAAAQHMADIERSLSQLFMHESVDCVIIDGELIVEEGELRIFDVPYLEYNDSMEPDVTPSSMFSTRRAALEELFEHDTSENLKLTRQAVTEDEKRALWAQINIENVEGGMLKQVDAPYEPGVRTKTQLKLKLVKTADVIVTSVERKFDHKGMVTHGSAGLALRIRPEQDPKPYLSAVTGKRTTAEAHAKMTPARQLAHAFVPREYLPVGASSLIGKDLSIDVDDVVEIAYLYWGGEAVVQPRILRKRLSEEKLAEDCWLDQIPNYSRKAV